MTTPKSLKNNKRSIVWQVKNTKKNIPDLRMLINPSDLSFNLKKIIIRTRTYGGFLEEHWGNDLNSVQANGKTAMFYNGGGLTIKDRQQSESMMNFNRLLDIYRENAMETNQFNEIISVGRIVMIIDSETRIFEGFFENFSIHEEAEEPFVFSYDFSFKVLRSFGNYGLSPNLITGNKSISSYSVENTLSADVNTTSVKELKASDVSSVSQIYANNDYSMFNINYNEKFSSIMNKTVDDPLNQNKNMILAHPSVTSSQTHWNGSLYNELYSDNPDAFRVVQLYKPKDGVTPPTTVTAQTPPSKLTAQYALGDPNKLKFQSLKGQPRNNEEMKDIDPIFAGRLAKLGSDLNILSTAINDGFRTTEQQRLLYNKFVAGTGNKANPPTQSWHEYGMAVDWNDEKIANMKNKELKKYGLCKPTTEPWHITPIEFKDQILATSAEGKPYYIAYHKSQRKTQYIAANATPQQGKRPV